MKPSYAIGIMSGTSLDGIDAVLIRAGIGANSCQIERIAHQHLAWPNAWTQAARDIYESNLLREGRLFGVRWADSAALAVRRLLQKSGISARRITVIGAHGQTVVHRPEGLKFLGARVPYSIQLGDFSRLAVKSGIPVVGNFRAADLAAGGQGAPLVPHAHLLMFSHPRRTVAVQNFGGIGNVTLLRGAKVELGFDTGPGNVWIDTIVRWKTAGRAHVDLNGRWARKGTVDRALLRQLLAHPYFRKKPPKSAGWENFGEAYLKRFSKSIRRLSIEDISATVTRATAVATANAYRRFIDPRGKPDIVVLCGGGARNETLSQWFAEELDGPSVCTSEAFGIPAQEVEAIAFALLALQALRGRANNEPRATGARFPVICGELALGRRGESRSIQNPS